MKKFALVAVLFASAAAFAIQSLDLNLSTRLSFLTGGLLVGRRADNFTDAKINANRITRSLAASATIDFAGLAGAGCAESSAITVTGAQVGDACSVGAPVLTAVDGGILYGNFSCFVSAADAVKVRFCAVTAENPASGSFEVRVISNN